MIRFGFAQSDYTKTAHSACRQILHNPPSLAVQPGSKKGRTRLAGIKPRCSFSPAPREALLFDVDGTDGNGEVEGRQGCRPRRCGLIRVQERRALHGEELEGHQTHTTEGRG